MQKFQVKEADGESSSIVSRYRLFILLLFIIITFGVMLGVIIWLATSPNSESDSCAQQLADCQASTGTNITTPSSTNKYTVPSSSTNTIPIVTTTQSSVRPTNKTHFPLTTRNVLVQDDLTVMVNYNSSTQLHINSSFGGFLHKDLQSCADSVSNGNGSLCLEWTGDRRLVVTPMLLKNATSLDCYEIEWTALSCPRQVLQNCLNVSTAHWYGGYADKHQYWPFEKNNRTMSAYLVNDSYIGEIGGVVERYFISSHGFGVYVDDAVPLYFSLNEPDDGLICFTAKFEDYPYFNLNDDLPILKYTVCHADNVKEVHKGMTELFFDKPRDIPDEKLFRYPIWSTWAEFHKDINQTNVLSFANDILLNNFTHAQIEIDDDWTPAYGDMIFNERKFPNATEMIRELNAMGFRVTVWVHPFFNADSRSFQELGKRGYLVTQRDSKILALTPWWDGMLTGILDVSNPEAVDWYLGQLQDLTNIYNISSFKFDAGETSWLPHVYSAFNMSLTNPAHMYPGMWVDLAMRADSNVRHQEVRAMYRTQRYPMFVRMMDKTSDWSHINGLKSIIPGVLTYGLLGYPFVLPDMIGGNAYENQPDAELFIRWIQLNTFLPGLQFSIVPWNYNETVVSIVRTFTELRERNSDTIIKYAKNSVKTGEPIIRPIWWVSPSDVIALEIEDEFLLGDEYLVAPIVEHGARSRDIYFPVGDWLDQTRSGIFTGPKWFYNYTADIDELPYFKLDNFENI